MSSGRDNLKEILGAIMPGMEKVLDGLRLTPEEMVEMEKEGFKLVEESLEDQEEMDREWENLKRLWDGKPQLPPRRTGQHRSIDESWIPTMRNLANYKVVEEESTPEALVICDLGPWDKFKTVTNAAHHVVSELHSRGVLPNERKLFYYDSCGRKDEILHENGVFKDFLPGKRDG